ncbi:hypothetical protein [Streptomyces griseiscabiei]|uniref:DUF3558 domain-containing protein n=1 Tax=Streptomyces griseiscabiei TaxID=2993540 RepID=A0ABU4LFV2_9ACTN|nr:hypothetical protein [Streptomyces griseiscabiei]MBZ3907150.1 hypothetical protein [Streptomyces griseiscabiei]MDX2914350.1 hypothetical protein [Streptomyces griseiscabiei]
MRRAAESDQHQSPLSERSPQVARAGRFGRSARSRVLAGAAVVPVMLLAVGCSSDSGSDGASGDDTPAGLNQSASETKTPEVVAAKYATLPDACEVFSDKTLKSVVPKGVKSGKAINKAEENVTGDCRWISLDNNGVDGSQYRWLSVSLHLLASNAANGPGEDRAAKAYESKITAAKAVDGAKKVKTEPLTGTGDQATVITYDLKKDDDTFKQQTIVVRTENVVITLDYNGAGLAGEKTPDPAALLKSAKSAAKEAVESIEDANDGTDASASPSKSASEGASKDTSKTPSADPTKASSSGGSGSDLSSDSGSGSDSDSDSGSSTSGTRKTKS